MDLDPIARLAKAGRYVDALTAIETNLASVGNPRVKHGQKLTALYVKTCLKLAQRKGAHCVEHLRRAETAVAACPAKKVKNKLQLLIYSTWAKYHQAQCNNRQAITYLLLVQKAVGKFGQDRSVNGLRVLAKTKLTLASLFMSLGRYADAKEQAEQSLAVVQGEVSKHEDLLSPQGLTKKQRKKVSGLITTMVIAFYNLGAAEEAMQRHEAAISALERAVALAKKHLPSKKTLIAMAQKALEENQAAQKLATSDVRSVGADELKQLISEKSLELKAISPRSTAALSTSKTLPNSGRATRPTSGNPASSRYPTSRSRRSTRPPTASAVKHKDKYYSERELFLLQRKMGNEGCFLTTDEFFSKKINKMLNISSDIVAMSPNLSPKELVEKSDRRMMADLFLRRHKKKVEAPNHEANYMKDKIAQMRLEEEERLIRLEQQMKCRQNIQSMKEANKPAEETMGEDSFQRRVAQAQALMQQPEQRLFFKAPWQSDETVQSPVLAKPTIIQKGRFELAKEGIETLLEQANNDLRKIDGQITRNRSAPNLKKSQTQGASPRSPLSPIVKQQPMSWITRNPHNELANSAQKTNFNTLKFIRTNKRTRVVFQDLVGIVKRKRAKIKEIQKQKTRGLLKEPTMMWPKFNFNS